MKGFALYRLPHERRITIVEQQAEEPLVLRSLEELDGQQGFVVAPFDNSDSCPLVLIQPDKVIQFESLENLVHMVSRSEAFSMEAWNALFRGEKPRASDSDRSTYSEDFAAFHAKLQSGEFSKVVLARSVDIPHNKKYTPFELFCRACMFYPRLFVSLVYTPQSGMWLTATPEVLLEKQNSLWHTIALAGTMKLRPEELAGEGEQTTWSTKNIQEQRYVATYLKTCLEDFAVDVSEEGPRTVRAAHLVHLRSDFTFGLKDDCHLGELLRRLHPTPAVCGLPKQETFRFIVDNEHTPRLYYSGFMGPLEIEMPSGEVDTRLFVSLRCMSIHEDSCRLYAGGGLLKDSTEEQEWQETEAKLETMLRVLD